MGSILVLGLQGSRKSVLQEVKAAEGWGVHDCYFASSKIILQKQHFSPPPGGEQIQSPGMGSWSKPRQATGLGLNLAVLWVKDAHFYH